MDNINNRFGHIAGSRPAQNTGAPANRSSVGQSGSSEQVNLAGHRSTGGTLGSTLGLNSSTLSFHSDAVHVAAHTLADATWEGTVAASPVS